MSQAPPPPPPHGENPRTTAGGSGLPPGKFDIFIIPEHSAGSGFLYLPSLKPQWNSFIAGVACTLATVVIGQTLAPAIKTWWANFQGLGNMGMVLLVIAVGLGSWSIGRTQSEGTPGSSGGYQRSGGSFGGSGAYYNTPPNGGPPPNHAPPPNNPPPPPPQHETPKNERPNNSWQDQPRHEQPHPQPQPQPQQQQQQQQQPPPPPPPQEPEPPRPQPPPQPKPQPRQTPQSPPPRPSAAKTDPKGAWEKAREETRRREEERKAREAELKRKEETARRLRELREREAREREQREKDARDKEARERERKEQEQRERARLEKEVRDKVERELREKVDRENREREAREREARERAAKERAAREALERELREREAQEARQRELARMAEEERQRTEADRRERAQKEAREREAKEARERQERLARLERERREREQKRKEEEEKSARKGSSYAYSSVGEKTSMWPNGKPPAASQAASSPGTAKPASPSPTKPTAASARSAAGTEEPPTSYRPYDQPKKPAARKKSVSDFSESSWAPSASTARTTPPPSMQGAYTTDDPQKIIIKAVYVFLNQFSKTPASQLISGVGSVTDGLILRITSAGLFVDDDRRGVAQREWDVKAWTIKSVEVWCPTHALNSAASNTPGAVPTNHPFFKHMPSTQRRTAERGATKTFLGEEAVAYLAELGRGCQDVCRLSPSASASAKGSSVSGSSNSNDKTGEWSSKGLHVLRVNIRDQEGKRYLFVINEEQSWKIAKGLQNLRGGTQVRALGVAGLSGLEAKTILETLGWS